VVVAVRQIPALLALLTRAVVVEAVQAHHQTQAQVVLAL
jgi:hypothetical protein